MKQDFSRSGIHSLEDFISLAQEFGYVPRDAIDGGAYDLRVSTPLLRWASGQVFAYEPIPENYQDWEVSKRLVARHVALGHRSGTTSMVVPQSGRPDGFQALGYSRRGFTGTIKSLRHSISSPEHFREYKVEQVSADEDIPQTAQIDFIKLDLQGGEMQALRGMERLLKTATVLWIEFTGSQVGLLQFLRARGFEIYETAYIFRQDPGSHSTSDFNVLTLGESSVGDPLWIAQRVSRWRPFTAHFQYWKRKRGLVQTDLLCLRPGFAESLKNHLNFCS